MRAEREMRRQKRRKRRIRAVAVLVALALCLLMTIRTFGMWKNAAELGGPEGFPSGISANGRDQKLPLNVPFLDQRGDWPTGCESVSAVMVLQYFDVTVTVEEFVDGYLPLGTAPHENGEGRIVGCDPRLAFPGDPRTEGGWGCYAPVIESSLKRFLEERPDMRRLSVEAPKGNSLPELCEEYVRQGIPVLVWATINMEPPQMEDSFFLEETGEEFQWIYPMHCLVLTGWDDTGYTFNDPMAGKETHYLKKETEEAYEALGRQAVALVPMD